MDGTAIFFSCVFLLLSIVIWKPLTAWYHEIQKRNRYMEAQIRLLTHLAIKSEVDPDKISDILFMAQMPGVTPGNRMEDKVRRLGLRRDLGFITQEEYEIQRQQVITEK